MGDPDFSTSTKTNYLTKSPVLRQDWRFCQDILMLLFKPVEDIERLLHRGGDKGLERV